MQVYILVPCSFVQQLHTIVLFSYMHNSRCAAPAVPLNFMDPGCNSTEALWARVHTEMHTHLCYGALKSN